MPYFGGTVDGVLIKVQNTNIDVDQVGGTTVVEGLIKSLDEPDSSLDAIWAEEAEKRLKAYRSGDLEGIPMEEIFKEE